MAISVLGKQVKITVETADGQVFSGTGLFADFNFSAEIIQAPSWDGSFVSFAGPSYWTIEICGTGQPIVKMGRADVENLRTASEWRYEFCGGVYPRKERKCKTCGAWRSFLYE